MIDTPDNNVVTNVSPDHDYMRLVTTRRLEAMLAVIESARNVVDQTIGKEERGAQLRQLADDLEILDGINNGK